ncbi:hypothetical protein Btru_069710 [Bulinus truncatus]|nr:hypothetical protein Btru_069710 [Bulinus truncatus]
MNATTFTMSFKIVLAVLAVAAVALPDAQGAFLLTASSSRVEVGITAHFTLNCSYWGDLSTTAMMNVTSIQITRENEFGSYVPLAGREDSGHTTTSSILDTRCQIAGLASEVDNSYLGMVWPIASAESVGNFRCDVSGSDVSQNAVTETSPTITIQEVKLTINDVLDQLNAQTKAVGDYCESLVAGVQVNLSGTFLEMIQNATSSAANQCSCDSTIFQEIISNQTDDLRRLTDELNQLKQNQTRIDDVIAEMNALKDKVALHGGVKYWPEGSYGLIMPESGCPVHLQSLWDTGFRKFLTASNDPSHNSIDANSHLKKPVLEKSNGNDFLYLHFCTIPYKSQGGPWPRGSYCIHGLGPCPAGFDSGYAYISGDKNNPLSTNNGNLPSINSGADYTQIFYCCRSDGPANVDVYLPNVDPFYLYRYKGACQRVEGMKVESEWVVMDTGFANKEMFDFFENSVHPDGDANNWSFELCYYHH